MINKKYTHWLYMLHNKRINDPINLNARWLNSFEYCFFEKIVFAKTGLGLIIDKVTMANTNQKTILAEKHINLTKLLTPIFEWCASILWGLRTCSRSESRCDLEGCRICRSAIRSDSWPFDSCFGFRETHIVTS